MRIVNFHEFCGLPDGTVFSYWDPCVVEGLYRRGSVISFDAGPKDFYESSLIAASWNCEFPVCDLVESRWGMFNYDQLFLVYEQQDIAVIAEGLGLNKKSEKPQQLLNNSPDDERS